MRKQVLIVCLIGVVLSSAVSCSQTQKVPDVDTEIQTETVLETESPVQSRLAVSVPQELSFEGADFTFLSVGTGSSFGYYSTSDLWAEGESGEAFNDAVYKRNAAVEQLRNVCIKTIDFDDPVPEIKRSVVASDCVYDAVWAKGYGIYNLAAKGYMADFNTLPYTALEQEWWDQNIRADYALYGKNYAMTGHISTRDDACTMITYFNKAMIAAYNLPSPYTLVETEQWTFDQYGEMVRAVSVDVNGDGIMTDGDTFGMIGEVGLINRMYLSLGGTFYAREPDGSLRLNITEERNIDIYNAIFTLMSDGKYVADIEKWSNRGSDGNVYGYARSLFAQDHFLFTISLPLVIEEFRDMESDFGIVPIPRFDEQAERYYATVDVNMPLLAVPVNVPDAEKTGAVLETMAWESLYTLTPVYNETLLKRKHARDTESADMLTLIARSRTYNLAAITDWGGLYSIGGEKFHAGKPLAVSDLEKKLAAANKAMEKDMEAFTAQQ